jgi:formate dehydrogenase subunit gamma
MAGAYDGMRYGYVDEEWAREHHEYWYNEVKSGKARTGTPTPGPTPRPRVA